MKNLYVILGLFLGLVFSGCSGVSQKVMQENMYIIEPDDVKKTPVVFFLQGSGGGNTRAYLWQNWFDQYGIASVIIDNSKIRNVKRLTRSKYASDISVALEALKSYEDYDNLDLTRYAIMGFSKGGTMAMQANNFLTDEQPKPDFVFSLYPGQPKGCPNTHGDKTDVFIFYGELDDWGLYKNTRRNCEQTAKADDKVKFYLLKDAHHGYDQVDYYARKVNWYCCGQKFTSAPNEKALNETRKIIEEAIIKKWNVKKIY